MDDAFSCLPQHVFLEETSPSMPMNNDSFAIELDYDDMLECFLNCTGPNEIPYPLDYALIHQHQMNDHGLHMNVVQMLQKFVVQQVGQEQLICY
jgi:hypothetical protein